MGDRTNSRQHRPILCGVAPRKVGARQAPSSISRGHTAEGGFFVCEDGPIQIGTMAAEHFGFTADKFDGYLWKKGNLIIVSFIVSRLPGQGNFSRLLDAIWADGYTVRVPTPFGHMQTILTVKGFSMSYVWDETFEADIECWDRGP